MTSKKTYYSSLYTKQKKQNEFKVNYSVIFYITLIILIDSNKS